jgi:hypothetical protein
MLRWLERRFYPFFTGVVIAQGLFAIEHAIRLVQVYSFGMPEDGALGLAGYVAAARGAEEWLGLALNAAILLALGMAVLPLGRLAPRTMPCWAFGAYLGGGVGLSIWQLAERLVIIARLFASGTCPCPGILDDTLGLPGTVLQFIYNLVACLATLLPFWWLRRARSPRPSVPAWA